MAKFIDYCWQPLTAKLAYGSRRMAMAIPCKEPMGNPKITAFIVYQDIFIGKLL
jgi:hypothetical protein